MKNKEHILQECLSSIILMQLLTESLEILPPEIRRQKIKLQIKSLISLMEPVIKQHYDHIYAQDGEIATILISEYEQLAKEISTVDLAGKVFLSQALAAYKLEPDKMEATAHRILKKNIRERD